MSKERLKDLVYLCKTLVKETRDTEEDYNVPLHLLALIDDIETFLEEEGL